MGFFSLKKKKMVRELSEMSMLHFWVMLGSFAFYFCFPFPFSTWPSETGILKNTGQSPLGACDGVYLAALLSGARQQYFRGIYHLGGKKKSVFLLKCIE